MQIAVCFCCDVVADLSGVVISGGDGVGAVVVAVVAVAPVAVVSGIVSLFDHCLCRQTRNSMKLNSAKTAIRAPTVTTAPTAPTAATVSNNNRQLNSNINNNSLSKSNSQDGP